MLISTLHKKRTKTHSQRGHTSLLGRKWQNTLPYSRTDMSGTADEASNSQIKHSIMTNKRRGRDGFNSYSYNSTTCWMTRKQKKGCFCILTIALWVVIVYTLHINKYAHMTRHLWMECCEPWPLCFDCLKPGVIGTTQWNRLYSTVKWHCWSLEFLFKIKALAVIICLH